MDEGAIPPLGIPRVLRVSERKNGYKNVLQRVISTHMLIVRKTGLGRLRENQGKEGMSVFSLLSDCFHLGFG